MGKQILIVLLACIFFISLVGADTAQQYTDYSIVHSVRMDGAPTTSALCNITILDPTDFILVSYQPMTASSASQTYNYTLPGTNISQLGIYCYDITCSLNQINQTQSFCFNVTPTGKEFTVQESIGYFLILLIVVGLFVFSLYMFFTLDFQNQRSPEGMILNINYKKYGKLFAGAMAYLFLVWIVYISWNLSFGYLEMLALALFFRYTFSMLVGLALPIFAVTVIVAIANFAKDKKYEAMMKRGMEPE